MTAVDLRRLIEVALARTGVRERWIIEVATRNAMIDDEGRITLPTYLGPRAITAGGAEQWLADYCPASAPADLADDIAANDEQVDAVLGAAARRAHFGAKIED
jgi:hypothetical protein